MGAHSYVDLEAVQEAEEPAQAGSAAAAEAPEGEKSQGAEGGDALAEAPAPASPEHGHDEHAPTGPDWKGTVMQCCGASLRTAAAGSALRRRARKSCF